MSTTETASPTMASDHPPSVGPIARPISSPGEAAARPVRILVDKTRAWVDPHGQNLLAVALANGHRTYGPGGARGFEGGFASEPVFTEREGDPLPSFPAGLVRRAVTILEDAGHAVEVIDRTPPRACLRLDESLVAGRGPEALAFARAIAGNVRGQIVARDRDRFDFLALLVRTFPEARITVVVASRRDAWRIGEPLGRRVAEPVLVSTGGLCRTGQRVRVATFNSMDDREADVVVFADSGEATHRRARDNFPHYEKTSPFGGHRAFGFTPPGGVEGRWRRFEVEALLGPVIYEVADPGGRPAGVVVRLADSPRAPATDGAPGLGRKRAAIWHDDRRNDVVARVALALAEGDGEALRKLGLSLDAGDDHADAPDRPARVAVLVESTEHGRELSRRLPGWDLRSGRPGPTSGDLPALDRSIVTLVHAHHLDPLDVDALVRADGGSGRLDLTGFPPRRPGPARRVVLVDFGDESDSKLAEATRGRLRAYQGLGWQVVAPASRSRHS